MERLFCLAAGMAIGNFLTAEVVARRFAGKGAAEVGSGNPGMASVAAGLGLRPGLLVLAGDLLKTLAACMLCAWLFPQLGRVGVLWAGLGCCLGHDYPVWRRFRGGKGVAVSCAALVLASPLYGTAACLAGLAVVLLTGWLSVGAVVIPLTFILPALLVHGAEAAFLAAVFAGLSVLSFRRDLLMVARGEGKRGRLWLFQGRK